MTMAPKPPKTLKQATALLGRYAEVDARLAAVEARRTTEIGRANASADEEAAPLIAELETISARIEPWWLVAGKALAKGRKSMTLGGCVIGTRAGQPKLVHGFDSDDKAVEALRATRYARRTTRAKYSIDRKATLKLVQLGGKAGEALGELGFRAAAGEQFFIGRVEQGGTIGAGA